MTVLLDAPALEGRFDADAAALADFVQRGAALADLRLDARRELRATLDAARERFLRAHVERLYDELTDGCARPLRAEALLESAADRIPGLVPTAAEVAAEREQRQADKVGVEIAQGLLLSHVLANPRTGAHLVWAMLRPTEEALARLDMFRRAGELDLGRAHVRRDGGAGVLELRNPRHLNAEDDSTVPPTELAVDLLLLDPDIEVAVFRGGVVDHPRYAGRRIFGSGINLTHLYHGRISLVGFFLVRDLGYVNKLYRGLSAPEHRPGEPEDTTEKPWIAAAETYAIGGACQLLHVIDHVLAERGCRMYLPARKEGIIPGASPLRLGRSVGDRLARQAILFDRQFAADTPEGRLICDQVVADGQMDAALSRTIEALLSSGVVSAAGNRKAIRVGQEPLDVFRQYMAVYAREQAACHYSPQLIRNLEVNWRAHQRTP